MKFHGPSLALLTIAVQLLPGEAATIKVVPRAAQNNTPTATGSDAPQITLPLTAPQGFTFGKTLPGPPARSASQTASAPTCTVTPYGFGRDDSAQIHAAVDKCGQGGTIVLPAPYVYTVAKRLYTKLIGSTLKVFGTLSFSSDLGYWINNSHRVEFQNQSTAWIVEGQDYIIDGGGFNQGGIDGNGQAWYTHAAGFSNQFGRPMSISVYNSSNVTIKDFSFRQPQFWAIWLQDSRDITLSGIYINGTNRDPYGNSSNYEVNVDGVDTYRVDNLVMKDWVFRGGDDCMALKGNTSNVYASNFTCSGGGMAFGSVGQYKDSPDYISNVTVKDAFVKQEIDPIYGGAGVSGGAYFKSWVGFAAGTPPQGGGGGTGYVSNVTFSNLKVKDTKQAVYINKCYFKVPEQGNYCDSSTFKFEDLAFNNVYGTVSGTGYGISLNCSAAAPCSDIAFTGLNLTTSNGTSTKSYCNNSQGVKGLNCTS